MSGGYFNHKNYLLICIADDIDLAIEQNDTPDEWGNARNYSDETIDALKRLSDSIRTVARQVHHADYLLSDDIGEEIFLKRMESVYE